MSSEIISMSFLKYLIAETLQKHNSGKVSLTDETLRQLCSILNLGKDAELFAAPTKKED